MASAPQPQDGLHAVGQAEVDQQKKHRREGHHDEHHDGVHRGLLPARPGHLLDLADHLTHVLGRVYCRHWVELLPTTPKPRRGAVVDSCSLCRDGPAASARPPVLLSCRRHACRLSWQEWRGSNPQPPVLETGALPVQLHSLTPLPPGAGPRRSELSRSEEHTSELQSLMRISYAVFCLKTKNNNITSQ